MDECRICLESSERKQLIAPCACSGTQKYVHRSCLDRWRTTREDRAFSRCTECLKDYGLICSNNNLPQLNRNRKFRYYCLISRDIFALFLFLQVIFMTMGFLMKAVDSSNNGQLLKLFGMTSSPSVFYYVTGLVVSLAILGLLSSIAYCMSGNSGAHNCTGYMQCFGDCCTPSPYYYYDPYYYAYGRPHFWLINTSPVHSGPPDSCSSCGCCDSSDGCDSCRTCESGDDKGECAVILLVTVVVVFAVIGLFVFIAMGIMLLQEVLRKHAHILHKRILARDYIVADLDAFELESIGLQRIRGRDLEDGWSTEPSLLSLPSWTPLSRRSQDEGIYSKSVVV